MPTSADERCRARRPQLRRSCVAAPSQPRRSSVARLTFACLRHVPQVPTNGYDPTRYLPTGRGSRDAILEEIAQVAARSDSWREQNQYVAYARDPVDADYLINWHYLRLARRNTSDGHAIALPLLRAQRDPSLLSDGEEGTHAGTPLLEVRGSCDYWPAPAEHLLALEPPQACQADTCAAGRYTELAILAGCALLAIALVGLLVPLVLHGAARYRCSAWAREAKNAESTTAEPRPPTSEPAETIPHTSGSASRDGCSDPAESARVAETAAEVATGAESWPWRCAQPRRGPLQVPLLGAELGSARQDRRR